MKGMNVQQSMHRELAQVQRQTRDVTLKPTVVSQIPPRQPLLTVNAAGSGAVRHGNVRS